MKRIGSAVLGLAVMATASFAQMLKGVQAKGPDENLTKFIPKDAAFTATAHVTVKDASGKEAQALEMSYAVCDGKVRTELDMTKSRGSDMPPQALAQMKQMGMDRVVTIYHTQTKTAYLIYPGLQACYEAVTPDRKADAQPNRQGAKVEKVELGKETIDGHPCVKSKVTVTQPNGDQSEALLWEATDLKNFPIQCQMANGKDTVTTTFRNVNQTRPDASQFEVPAGYQRYGSMQEMMMGNMQRLMAHPPE